MAIKTIPLSRFETDLKTTFNECAASGEAFLGQFHHEIPPFHHGFSWYTTSAMLATIHMKHDYFDGYTVRMMAPS